MERKVYIKGQLVKAENLNLVETCVFKGIKRQRIGMANELVHSMANELVPHQLHSPPTSLSSSTSTLACPETKSMTPLSSGTGKSSLIAAVTNYAKFDVCDLELTIIYGDFGVMEDIDCSLEMQKRQLEEEQTTCQLQLTLSGLLNFTTNHQGPS